MHSGHNVGFSNVKQSGTYGKSQSLKRLRYWLDYQGILDRLLGDVQNLALFYERRDRLWGPLTRGFSLTVKAAEALT